MPDENALLDPHHIRDSLIHIKRAVTHGWDVKAEWMAKLPIVCAQLAISDSEDPRTRLRAMEVLRAMAKDRVDAAVALDKIERLDSGNVDARTEIIVRHVNKPRYEDQ